MSSFLEAYLHELRTIRSTGAAVNELSYYPPLAEMLNQVGAALRPRVRCIQQVKSTGAGMPDLGLFTADQFQRAADLEPLPGQKPARGVVEAKGPAADLAQTRRSAQIARYLDEYGLVLLTNYREFLLLAQDAHGQPAVLEDYCLANSEAAFWDAVKHLRQTAAAHGERLVEFLRRALLHAAPLADPKDLAWFLASYARDARVHLEQLGDLPALAALRQALGDALGMQFQDAAGSRFFRSTLIQTLFYGVFAAWVLWHHEHPGRQDDFDWRLTTYYLHVPIIQSLFHQLSNPLQLRSLGLIEFLDRAGAVLNRVDRAAFFTRFEEGHAVQYFYEPFLEAYDPALRKDMGVWYTPPEIVQYMVARVDTVLRQELGAVDGLADPNVLVLDPCCGTGAYLVAVLQRIAAALQEKGEEALLGYRLKRAALERVLGFELLPAPFIIAHLQLGLFLQQHGAPLGEAERAGVYLTNALTGWDPLDPDKARQIAMALPELQAEHDAAQHVKRDSPILVVLGNPPYNAFAGIGQTDEERALVQPYKEGLIETWGIKKFNLDDLYVRFFRLAERRIAEMTGRGVVCFISNYSWLSEPSFVVMRQHLLTNFDRFWVENLHGDRTISEYAPDGRTSQTIFAISGFSPGIRQGVATSLWLKSGQAYDAQVLFRDDLQAARADERRAQLLDSLQDQDLDARYQPASPAPANRFSFRPSDVAEHYLEWPKLVDLCAEPPSNGLMEKRGGALIAIDRAALETRMRMYYDPAVDWPTLADLGTGLTKNAARFDAQDARYKVLAAEAFQPSQMCRYLLRPFDSRWCYYSAVRPLWNEPRPSYWAQYWEGNAFLMSRPAGVARPEGAPFYHTALLGDNDFMRGHAYYFPWRWRVNPGPPDPAQMTLLEVVPPPRSNLSPTARAYLAALGIADPDAETELAPGLRPYELVWLHALAIGYAPAYRDENADGIRQDWPRIPLPASRDALLASAALGRQVAALLDTETPVPGVTAGIVRPELRDLAVLTRVGGGALQPGTADLALTAGWGYAGKGGAVMPGQGKIVERAQVSATWGPLTCDVYLNDVAYWRHVPPAVWDYIIGGYQVIKKWLSYREQGVLGRPLTADEAVEVTHMARRIAALVQLQPALNANYRAVTAATYAWPGTLPQGEQLQVDLGE